MPEHVLVVGGGLDFPAVMRGLSDGIRTTLMCRLESVATAHEPAGHRRILGMRADATTEEWVAAAADAHRADPFTRIGCFGEHDQDRAAAVAAALGLPGHRPETVRLVHHKPSMRERLRAAGVDPTPAAVVRDEEELRAFVAEHGYPCIAKPADGVGSVGIRRIESAADLAPALAVAGERGPWASGEVLVERFHRGPQFSVESFSEGGRHRVVCLTRKFSDPRTYVEVGHVLPARVPEATREAIAAHVEAVLDAVGITFGPTCTEVVWTDEGPRTIETHVRMSGARIPYLVRSALGVDLPGYTARQIAGETGLLARIDEDLAEAARRPARHDAIWFAVLGGGGRLESVTGLEEVRALEHVEEAEVHVTPGSDLEPLASAFSRIGYVRAYGPDPGAAVERAQLALDRIGFHARLDVRPVRDAV
ncbi:ATP-grasp domain-containing protein [Kitasatospora purpeofusca]|uniref:ATP-grasp domain-containing protein n=1 Tax=Kitasatospora purpeofusca TaxID=67352 RepID=A0ABZ1U8G9_9ACTN|nr:ATP-grasp domain-containing protein [Kitasatospora purpeofusca]